MPRKPRQYSGPSRDLPEPQLTPEEKKARRVRTKEFLNDADAVDLIIERIAGGEGLRNICRELQIAYSTTQVHIAEHYQSAYEAAKRVRADDAIDQIEELEGRLERGDMNFNDFRELSNSKQWRAEKLNKHAYGDHQTIDMTVVDKTQQHLDSLRQLVRIERDPPRQALPAPTREPILEAQILEPSNVGDHSRVPLPVAQHDSLRDADVRELRPDTDDCNPRRQLLEDSEEQHLPDHSAEPSASPWSDSADGSQREVPGGWSEEAPGTGA